MATYNPNEFQPGYGGVIDSEGNVKNIADVIQDGKVQVDASFTLDVGDIKLGAVEISDATEATRRLKVNEDGSINTRIVGSIHGGVF